MIKKLISGLVIAGSVLLSANSAFAYTVEKGDTLYGIANKHDMSLAQVVELNPQIDNINLIYVGQNVKTEAKTQAAAETKKQVKETKTASVKTNANNSDLDLLARLVRAEAQGESFEGKVAVAEVVINRVNSSQFPNSISSVIYQSGQFSPVMNGHINKAADQASINAAKEALNSTADITNGAVFFYNASTATSRWLDTRPTITIIGNHTFKM